MQPQQPMGIAQPAPQVPPHIAQSPQFGAAKAIAMEGLPQLFKQLFDEQVTFEAMELLAGADRQEAMDNAPPPNSIKAQNEQGLNAILASLGPGIRQRGNQMAEEQLPQQGGLPTQPANNMAVPRAAQGGIVGFAQGGLQKKDRPIPAGQPSAASQDAMAGDVANYIRQYNDYKASLANAPTPAEKQQVEGRWRVTQKSFHPDTVAAAHQKMSAGSSMAGGGIVSFQPGGSVDIHGKQVPFSQQQFRDFTGPSDQQKDFEAIAEWVRNYQIEPEIADLVLNNPNSVAGDQIDVLKQVLIGAGGRTLDEVNRIVESFTRLRERGNVNPRGERDFSRAEAPVEGRGLMALGQDRAAQNAAAREAPLSDFQQSLVDAEEANVGQQLRDAERRMELEGRRVSPGNRMSPEEVERRREEYRQSRPTQPRSQPMTPEEIAATRSQYGLGTGVAPQEPTGSGDGEGYDFGALAEGLGISGLLDTAKQVGQDVFMGGYSGEEILDRTMPTRMEAFREGRGLTDLDEYEQGAVGREALTFVPNYLRTVLFPDPDNERLGTLTLGEVGEAIEPRARGFLGMERDGDAEVAADVITSGPEEISAETTTTTDSPPGRVNVSGRRTDAAGLQAPTSLVSALDRGNQTADQIQAGLAAFDSDAQAGAGTGTSPNVTAGVQDLQNLANSASSGGMQNYQAEIDRLIARDTNPIRTLAQYGLGVGKGNTPLEGMMLGSEMLDGIEKKLDADRRALMGLIEAQRISERDAEQAQERLRIQQAQVDAMLEGDFARAIASIHAANQRNMLTPGDILRARLQLGESEELTQNLRTRAERNLLVRALGEDVDKTNFFGRSEAEKLLADPDFQAEVDREVERLLQAQLESYTGQ